MSLPSARRPNRLAGAWESNRRVTDAPINVSIYNSSLPKDVTVANHPADPRDDPNMVQIPFIFVKHGDPLRVQWMAEHPDYFKVPAIMVPHGSPPPWPWGGANAGPAGG